MVETLADAGPPATADAEVLEFAALLGAAGLTEPADERARHRQAAYLRAEAFERVGAPVLACLRHAASTTRFHRRLSSALAHWQSIAELARLPLMTKEDLQRGFPDEVVSSDVDLDARLADGRLVMATTSGTVGERLQVVSDTSVPRIPPGFEHWWGLGSFGDEAPRTAVFTTPICAGPICHLGRSTMAERTHAGINLFLNSTEDLFGLGRPLVENVLDELHAFAPAILFVHPWYLAVLVRRAQAFGLPLPRPRVILSCYQLLTPACRRILSEAFSCPVIDFYSATEFGGFVPGLGCAAQRLHLRVDQALVEVLGPSGLETTEALGWLAVTTRSEVMPLVRYLPGDVGRWVDRQCECALGAEWPLFEVHGRASDVLETPRGWVTPRQVDDALGACVAVDFAELEERAEGFVARVVLAPGQSAPARLEALEALLSREVTVQVVQRLRPERSFKFRTVIPRGAGLPRPATLESSRA